MLPFLRKIRRRHISENSSDPTRRGSLIRQYFLYALGEIALIDEEVKTELAD